MNISQKGIDLIKSYEGCRLSAYKPVPTEKYWTIGYGHYGPDVKPGMQITAAQAEEFLRKDVKRFVDGVNELVHTPINQNQFDALVSLAYNIGLGGLKKSSILKYVNDNAFQLAAEHFADWIRGGGKVLPGLVRRRNEEMSLFLTAVKPTAVYWDGTKMKKGQIGRLEVLKPINLYRRDKKNKRHYTRVLHVGERYRVYGYDEKTKQYNVGGGYWITNMPGYLKFETPAKAKLDQLKELYGG